MHSYNDDDKTVTILKLIIVFADTFVYALDANDLVDIRLYNMLYSNNTNKWPQPHSCNTKKEIILKSVCISAVASARL